MPRRSEINPALKTASQSVRATIDVPAPAYYRLATTCRDYNLNTGEVIATLMGVIDALGGQAELDAALRAARTAKVAERAKKSAINKTIRKLGEEALAKLDEALDEQVKGEIPMTGGPAKLES